MSQEINEKDSDDVMKHRLQGALHCLRHEKDFATVEEIEDLLDDVLAFLSKQEDNSVRLIDVVKQYSEVGQILSLLNCDKRLIVKHSLCHKIWRGILWFYRSNPEDACEQKTSQWALDHMAESLVACENLCNPARSSLLPQLPVGAFTRLFQDCLLTFIGGLTAVDEEQHLNWLVRTSRLVLLAHEPDLSLLELLIDTLPSNQLYDTGQFVDELATKLDNDDTYPPYFIAKVVRKYPAILENQLVNLIAKWIASWPEHVNDVKDIQWLTQAITTDDKLFQQVILILHSALDRLEFHVALLDLIQKLFSEIKKQTSLCDLYPEELVHLAYLLDMDVTCLSQLSHIKHCEYVLSEILRSIHTGQVTVTNIKMILSHFPNWCADNLKTLIHSSNQKVRFDVCLLISLLNGDSFLEVFNNLDGYFH